jgi:hypothetical protein
VHRDDAQERVVEIGDIHRAGRVVEPVLDPRRRGEPVTLGIAQLVEQLVDGAGVSAAR